MSDPRTRLPPLPPQQDRLIWGTLVVVAAGLVCFVVATHDFVRRVQEVEHSAQELERGIQDLDRGVKKLEEVLNRPADFYWPFPSVVTVASEQDLQDQRCEIAQALLTRMRTLDEGGPPEVRRNIENVYGEVLEGSATAVFQAPEALWLVDYSPRLRENAALVFYKIPHDGSSEREVRDYGLDCTADVGYLEGDEIFDPADEDSYEENMFFSESAFPGDHGRGEHYRPYWQEELDHAYRAAAQAFGI